MRSSGAPVIGSEAINVTVCSPPEEIGSCFTLSSRLTRPVLFSRGTVVVRYFRTSGLRTSGLQNFRNFRNFRNGVVT